MTEPQKKVIKTCFLRQTNHLLGCQLESIAGILEYRGYNEEAEMLRLVAARIK